MQADVLALKATCLENAFQPGLQRETLICFLLMQTFKGPIVFGCQIDLQSFFLPDLSACAEEWPMLADNADSITDLKKSRRD